MNSGNQLGIKMDRLSQASSALSAAMNWSATADVAVACDAETPFEQRPSFEQVDFIFLLHQAFESVPSRNVSISRLSTMKGSSRGN